MVSILPVQGAQRALVPIPKPQEQYSLALDTLEKMVLVLHRIDDNGHPIIHKNMRLDHINEREVQLFNYINALYSSNKELREKLTSQDGKLKLNLVLKELSTYNPKTLMIQNISFLDTIRLLKQPTILSLIKADPRFTLSLITAEDCGLRNNDKSVRIGALSLIVAIAKHIEYNISSAKEINTDLMKDLSNIILIRKLLNRIFDHESDSKVQEHASFIDNEIELFEEFSYWKCNELKKEKVLNKTSQSKS